MAITIENDSRQESFERLFSVLLGLNPDIPTSELVKLKELFTPRHFTKGSLFCQSGTIPTQLGFVTAGLFRYYYIDLHGVEVTKHFCPENSFAASYSALLSGMESDLNIEALEDSSLLVCDYSQWGRLLESDVCWQIVARRVIERIFVLIERRERGLLLEDAHTRYINFLRQYPQLRQRLKQYHIASYLGISPVSLSRIHAKQHFS